jgi:hypothetical protein
MVQPVLAALLLLAPQQSDTATFRDAATAELYARARVRHIRQDSLVRDYRAIVETRAEARAGRSRFAGLNTLLAHESRSRVTWRSPNDLKVEVLGARSRAPIIRMLRGFGADVREQVEDELRQDLVPERPWFIPRSLGDSIRVMGVPETAVLHPLADDALDYYRFAITDSVELVLPSRTVQAIKMEVRPKRFGPALVSGDMWLDATTGDVVRLMVIFVGEYLWDNPEDGTPEDSAQKRRENRQADRYLSVEADIEYALVDNLYWMPHRQLLALTADIPFILNITIPARVIVTFSEYEVNTSPHIEFVVPDDSLEAQGEVRAARRRRRRERERTDADREAEEDRRGEGYVHAGAWRDGRWEVDVPPDSTLAAYEWETEFRVQLDKAEEKHYRESFARLSELQYELPPEWTGRQRLALAWERFAEIVQYNRVQALSLGIGVQLQPGPDFTTVLLTGRFGIGDLRPTGSVLWRYDGPDGQLDLRAYRAVFEAEPWTKGLTIGNSMNAFWTGHDDADYYLASGGGWSFAWNHGLLRETRIAGAVEFLESMEKTTDVAFPNLFGDFTFQENPPVDEGWFFRGTLSRRDPIGPVTLREGAEVLAGDDRAGGRLWSSLDVPFSVLRRTGNITVRAGVALGDTLEQFQFRLGGPQTVRGYTYGTRRGRSFWSAQLDYALMQSAWISPVVFVDVGDSFDGEPLVGVGAGVSLLSGLVRFDFSKGLRAAAPGLEAPALRFDLRIRAPR